MDIRRWAKDRDVSPNGPTIKRAQYISSLTKQNNDKLINPVGNTLMDKRMWVQTKGQIHDHFNWHFCVIGSYLKRAENPQGN